jgi:hypothetical protein
MDTEARGKILSPLPGIESRMPGDANLLTWHIDREDFIKYFVMTVLDVEKADCL